MLAHVLAAHPVDACIGVTIPPSTKHRNVLQMGPVASKYSSASQSVSPLVVGKAYTLSFYLANSATSGCSIVVTFGKLTLLSSANAAIPSWTFYNLPFNATATSQTLTFAAYNTP